MCLLTLHNDASYTVSVRQYRILPCRFLQCIPHGKPPCVVLILPISFRAYKGLAPSGKKTPAQSFVLTKNSCIFGFFLLLCSRCALLMQGTHNSLNAIALVQASVRKDLLNLKCINNSKIIKQRQRRLA